MAKSKNKNLSFLTLLISFIVALISRMILLRIIGSKGVAYFSVPNEIFFFVAGLISFGLEEAIGAMIESRMYRQQYNNALKVAGIGIIYAFSIGIIVTLVLLLSHNSLVDKLFNVHLSYMAFMIMLPAIPLFILTGAFRGFFKGTNYPSVTIQSELIFAVTYGIAGGIGAFICQNYGEKVSNLLRSEEFAPSYGALGAAIGILTASIVTFVHILIMYILMKRRTVYSNGRDYSRNIESTSNIILNIAGTALVPSLTWASICFVPVINIIILFKAKDTEFSMDFAFGEYYGKTSSITGILVFVLTLFAYPFIRKAIGAIRKEEYRVARDKLKAMIHRCATLTFFVCAMLVVLADNLLEMLFEQNGENTVFYLQLQAICLIFAVFAAVFLEMIINMKNYIYALGITVIALAAHIVFTVIFISSAQLSIPGMILSNLIFYVVIDILGFLFISRAFSYTQEWFRTFVVTIIAALISALLGMLINKAIAPLTGMSIAMLIVLILGVIIYVIILLALRGYAEEELESSAIGRIVLALGRMFNLV